MHLSGLRLTRQVFARRTPTCTAEVGHPQVPPPPPRQPLGLCGCGSWATKAPPGHPWPPNRRQKSWLHAKQTVKQAATAAAALAKIKGARRRQGYTLPEAHSKKKQIARVTWKTKNTKNIGTSWRKPGQRRKKCRSRNRKLPLYPCILASLPLLQSFLGWLHD